MIAFEHNSICADTLLLLSLFIVLLMPKSSFRVLFKTKEKLTVLDNTKTISASDNKTVILTHTTIDKNKH
jgi:hypothetical protein